MSQLRSCYFCGVVGDSLREYEVVPERLVSPDETRSAVLCSTCHEKLRRVLEPLVEAAESCPTGVDHGVADLGEVTFESDDGATDGRRDADERTPDIEETESGNSTDLDPETDPDDDPGDDSEADTGDGEPTDDQNVPDGYYKVLRLLQNREFPMERTDLTALVTGAYDVSEPQCERILAAAIDRGVLIEDGSTLDIGRN
jgi:hypothetical protein